MLLNKKRVHVEWIFFPIIYMVLYKTKIGLILMDRAAKKFPRLVGLFSFLAVIFGFAGMAAILFLLINGTYAHLFNGAPPPVAPLFPGVKSAPGVPVMSFFHWIIAIFILATVHEFSHGLVSRLYNIRVKSSGFAIFGFFLPIIPAAFVEPDEYQLSKAKIKEQLGVLAAGSFSNLINALLSLLIFSFVLVPAFSSTIYSDGVLIVEVQENYPANLSGVNSGEEILEINNLKINNVRDFLASMDEVAPGDKIELVTNESSYLITTVNPPKTFFEKLKFWKKDTGYLGIFPISLISEPKEGMETISKILSWVSLLFFWIFAANLGVGLFNLLPMGPLDGGKMFYLVALNVIKKENIAKKVWIGMGLFCIALILISLLPFLAKLLTYLLGFFVGLF